MVDEPDGHSNVVVVRLVPLNPVPHAESVNDEDGEHVGGGAVQVGKLVPPFAHEHPLVSTEVVLPEGQRKLVVVTLFPLKPVPHAVVALLELGLHTGGGGVQVGKLVPPFAQEQPLVSTEVEVPDGHSKLVVVTLFPLKPAPHEVVALLELGLQGGVQVG